MKLIKKISTLTVLLLGLTVWSSNSHANLFFWEFNVGSGDFQPETGTDEDITVFSGAFGGFFTRLVTYELQYGFGWDDRDGFGGTPEVSHAAGMVGINLGSRNAHITLMGGVGLFDVDTAANDVDGDGVALGFSLNLYADEHSGLSIEALNINDDDNGEYGIISVGYKKKF